MTTTRRLDVFVVNGAPSTIPRPRGRSAKGGFQVLESPLHQKQDGTFEDATQKAGLQGVGYGMGVAVGDYDNDGYEDLYVTAYAATGSTITMETAPLQM